jgi:hypothetical protein
VASAWGNSWGVAWGNSWGSTTPTPPTPTDFSTIGGGGGFKLFRERQDDDRKELRRAIKMAMGLVDDPRPEVREEAKAILSIANIGRDVAGVTTSQPNKLREITSVIMESRIKFEAILVHFEQLKSAKLAEDEEDEEIALVLLN